MNKKAFSIVEIIIVISIIAILSIIAIYSQISYKDKTNNTKVSTDISTINNALESFSQENGTLPMPGGNKNFYTNDTTYAHGLTSTGVFGVYGQITENTIPKKYLDILPLDPRTNSYYSYGKTLNTNQFEIAAINIIDTVPVAKVTGNYTAENGPYNLIREYNGPNFVTDNSNVNLPYNPYELALIATDKNGNIYKEGDTLITGAGETIEIFFSDGSVSVLEENSELTLNTLDFPTENNLNTVIKLALGAGTIWTRATDLDESSKFEVHTLDTVAAVRGTIFGVTIDNDGKTKVEVIEGSVEIYEIPQPLSPNQILDNTTVLENTETLTPFHQKIEKGHRYIRGDYEAIPSPETLSIPFFSEADDKSITLAKLDLVRKNSIPDIGLISGIPLSNLCDKSQDGIFDGHLSDGECIEQTVSGLFLEDYTLKYYEEDIDEPNTLTGINLSGEYIIEMKIDDKDEITGSNYIFSNEGDEGLMIAYHYLNNKFLYSYKSNILQLAYYTSNNIIVFKNKIGINIFGVFKSETSELDINHLRIGGKYSNSTFDLSKKIEYIKIYSKN